MQHTCDAGDVLCLHCPKAATGHMITECWNVAGSLILLTFGMIFKGPLLVAPTLGSTALRLTLGCLL